MKTDVGGCSTCAAGQEFYESFYSPTLGRRLVQYDYRTSDGRLYSTVAPTLEACRQRRDAWLKAMGLCERPMAEQVPAGDECPRCGENCTDRLIWEDDERVRCASCGAVYEPPRRPKEA